MPSKSSFNKRAAVELSVSTIVIIVLAMSMLILGLVLVRSIFSVATESVGEIDGKLKDEIIKLFGEEEKDVIVKLGSDKTARIKQGTNNFAVAIGAQTKDGSKTNRERLKYKLTLDKYGDCLKQLGQKATEGLFTTKLNVQNSFDDYADSHAFARVQLSIPEGTKVCTQKVFIDVTDTSTNTDVGGSSFIIEIIKKGFF